MIFKRILTLLFAAGLSLQLAMAQGLPNPETDYGSNMAGYLFSGQLARQDNPAFDRSIAATPPMGWNSWNAFRCDVDEARIKAMADKLVTSGLAAAGYIYVVIDDCWQGGRDAEGKLYADTARFPSGMTALADYIHAKGLKFGLYSSMGYKTCQGRPGSRGFEALDARTFASWGVDYLKYDWCYAPTWQEPFDAYARMRDALVATGRPIYFSASAGLRSDVTEWAPRVAHGWRFFKDIRPCWDCTGDRAANGIMNVIDQASQRQVALLTRPGSWADADMLEVGNHGLNAAEQQAHFALWVAMASPLMIGTDLRTIAPGALKLLLNRDLIAAHQDRLGLAGFRYRDFGQTEIWRRWLEDGVDGRRNDMFVLLNRDRKARVIELKVDAGAVARDMMAGMAPVPVSDGVIALTVPGHAARVLHTNGMRFKN